MTQVRLEELRAAAELLLLHIKENGGDLIDISEDFYWDVAAEDRYDNYQEPKKHTVGQLSDDISQLKHLLSGKSPIVGYGLVWLASVLRRVGETSTG
jgi:hypothetical protein